MENVTKEGTKERYRFFFSNDLINVALKDEKRKERSEQENEIVVICPRRVSKRVVKH